MPSSSKRGSVRWSLRVSKCRRASDKPWKRVGESLEEVFKANFTTKSRCTQTIKNNRGSLGHCSEFRFANIILKSRIVEITVPPRLPPPPLNPKYPYPNPALLKYPNLIRNYNFSWIWENIQTFADQNFRDLWCFLHRISTEEFCFLFLLSPGWGCLRRTWRSKWFARSRSPTSSLRLWNASTWRWWNCSRLSKQSAKRWGLSVVQCRGLFKTQTSRLIAGKEQWPWNATKTSACRLKKKKKIVFPSSIVGWCSVE